MLKYYFFKAGVRGIEPLYRDRQSRVLAVGPYARRPHKEAAGVGAAGFEPAKPSKRWVYGPDRLSNVGVLPKAVCAIQRKAERLTRRVRARERQRKV